MTVPRTIDRLLEDPVLRGFLSWLRGEHEDNLDFAVLYGSRSRGSARRHSDYDILIGLRRNDTMRFVDRLLVYNNWDEYPQVEAKAFTPEEIEGLWWHLARTLIDPLYEGIPLYGSGRWREWKERFQVLLAQGVLRRQGTTWIWDRERDPDLQARLDRCRQVRAR